MAGIDFTRELSDPTNKINERAGKPALDTSVVFNSLNDSGGALKSTLEGGSAREEKQVTNQFNLDLNNTMDEAYNHAAASPEMATLNKTAQAVKQGRATSQDLYTRAQVLSKQYKNTYPEFSSKFDEQAQLVIGKVPSQGLFDNATRAEKEAQSYHKSLVESAISSGNVVLKNGSIDENASIDAQVKYSADVHRAASIQRDYENGIHTKAIRDDKMTEELRGNTTDVIAKTVNNAVNSNVWTQLKQLPAAEQDAQLKNLFQEVSSSIKIQTDEQYARAGFAAGPNQDGSAGVNTGAGGLSSAAINQLRTERDAQLKAFEENIIPKVSHVEEMTNLSNYADKKANVDNADKFPVLFGIVKTFGAGSSDMVKNVLESSATKASGQSLQNKYLPNEVSTGLSTSAKTKTLQDLHYINSVGNNNKSLPAAVAIGDTQRIPQTVQVARTMAKQSNDLTPQQDKAYNTVHQNLTGLAVSDLIKTDSQDLANNVKEVTSPLHTNALLTSKAKQYNISTNDQSIKQTVAAIEKAFVAVPRLLKVDGLKIDPETGVLMQIKADSGSLLGAYGAPLAEQQQANTANNVKTYNQMIDTYIKFKSETPYKSLGDGKIRELLNQRLLPDLAPKEEPKGQGGAHTPAPASSGSGGMSSAEIKKALRNSIEQNKSIVNEIPLQDRVEPASGGE